MIFRAADVAWPARSERPEKLSAIASAAARVMRPSQRSQHLTHAEPSTTLCQSLVERPNLVPWLLNKAREKSRAFVILVKVGLC